MFDRVEAQPGSGPGKTSKGADFPESGKGGST
jgi:hypothetical protein